MSAFFLQLKTVCTCYESSRNVLDVRPAIIGAYFSERPQNDLYKHCKRGGEGVL
jgi:hypothetical protein